MANLEYSTAYCTYNNDDGCTPINGCGAGTMSYFYFYSFTLLVSFVFVNLFIAIILEGFADYVLEDDNGKPVGMDVGFPSERWVFVVEPSADD